MTPGAALSISSDMVGTRVGPVSHAIDARWLQAYAAALGETDARYYDTLAPDGPAAHPVFAVCYEWPLALAIRAKTIGDEIAPRGVHLAHDLTINRPPCTGDTLWTSARVVEVTRRPSGARVTVRFETVDADGAPVTTTDHASVYRGAHVAGADRDTAREPPEAEPALEPVAAVSVPAYLAHVYSECARIWNPIHTDIAVARRAGLPDIILHGTATLALAVSRVLTALGDGDPRRVRRVAGRFTGMVRLPSTFTVRMAAGVTGATAIRFDAIGEDGRPVLSQGALYR